MKVRNWKWIAGVAIWLLGLAVAFWLASTGKSLPIAIIIALALPTAFGILIMVSNAFGPATLNFFWVMFFALMALMSLDHTIQLLSAPHHSTWDICQTILALQGPGAFLPFTLVFLVEKSRRYPAFGVLMLLVPTLGILLRHLLIAPFAVGVLGGLALGLAFATDLLNFTPALLRNRPFLLLLTASAGINVIYALAYQFNSTYSPWLAGWSSLLVMIAVGFIILVARLWRAMGNAPMTPAGS